MNKSKQLISWKFLCAFAVIVFLLVLVPASGNISLAAETSPFWYYADNEQIFLPLSPDEVTVGFVEGVTASEKDGFFTNMAALAEVNDLPTPELTVLKFENDLNEDDYMAMLDDLRADPGVAFAYPVFALPDARMTLTNQFVARFKPEVSTDAIAAFNAENDVQIVQAMRLPNTYILSVKPGADSMAVANRYHESGLTVYGTPDFIRFLTPYFSPNDPLYPNQWGMENNGTNPPDGTGTADADMDASTAWDISTGSAGVTIAIIDEGVELDHPDLDGKIVGQYTAVTADPDANPNNTTDAHGTNVAGIAAAETNNAQGVAGVCPDCSLLAVQIAYSVGGFWVTNDTWIADAMTWAVDNGADVLSNSWGGGSPSTMINDAITHAVTNGRGGLGAPVLFASGNGNSSVSYPATNNDTIAVGATSPCDERKSPTSCDGENWWGSNYGSALDVVSPGVEWWTTDMTGSDGYGGGDYFDHMNGTSSATPAASGLAGLILSYRPCLTEAQVQDILEQSAEDQVGIPAEDTAGWDQYMGWGRINAHDALVLAGGYTCTESCGPKVYFDIYHDGSGDTSGNSTALANLVINTLGGTFEEKDQFIDSAALDGYSILVISDPEDALDPAEISAIHDFVANGGRLVVLGEWGGAANNATLNDLLSGVGVNISLNGDTVYDDTNNENGNNFWPLIHQFEPHSLTNGVAMSVLYASSSLSGGSPAIPIASLDNDGYSITAAPAPGSASDNNNAGVAGSAPQDVIPGAPVVMAYSQAGAGDVFVAGDSGIWEDGDPDGDGIITLNEYDHQQLALNVFNHDDCTECYRILFDETHGWATDATVGDYTIEDAFSELAAFLQDQGHVVESLQDPAPFNYATISQYDVLVLMLPKEYYSAAEKAAIDSFVNQGGRLVAISEWGAFAGTSSGILNDVHAYLGDGLFHNADSVFDPTDFVDSPFWPLIQNFSPAPVNNGLNSLVQYASSSLQANGAAFGTAFGDDDAYNAASPSAAQNGLSGAVPSPSEAQPDDNPLEAPQPETGVTAPNQDFSIPEGKAVVNGVLVPAEEAVAQPESTPSSDAPVAPQAVNATTINFDDQVQPCVFVSTVALRDEYLGMGVSFTGPGLNDGGAILDECGGFGVSGYSAPNFLAFNTTANLSDGGVPAPPERISFAQPVSYVEIKAGAGSSTDTLLVTAYDASDNYLGSDSISLAPALQTLSISANGISYVVLDTTSPVFVVDDLAFTQQIIVQAMSNVGAGDVFAIGDANLWDNGDHESNALLSLFEFDNAQLAHNVFAFGDICSGCRVALFKDNINPWSGETAENSSVAGFGIQGINPDPNEEILQSWHIPYDIFSSADMGSIDLSPYCKVIVASNQPDSFYPTLSSNRAWFENWISDGGMFELHGATYYVDDWNGLLMPGGFSKVLLEFQEDVSIVDFGHSIINVPNAITGSELDNWNSSTHGYLVDLPAGTNEIIAHEPSGEPVAVEFDLDQGCVVATDQPLEWAWALGYSRILENFIKHDQCEGPPAQLWIDPPVGDILLNEQDTVDITVSDVDDMYAVALELTFDPTILQVVDADLVTPGVQIAPGSCPSPDYVWQNTVDNVSGTINYDATQLDPTLPCDGGIVAPVEFECIATGTSPVNFTEHLISDIDGIGINATTQDGSVTCHVNTPPNTPSNPTPAHLATDVSTAADLSWSGSDPDPVDTLTYDVKFGTSTPPVAVLCDDTAVATCDPGALDSFTTYYWQVIATDNHGASTNGPIWQFTTQKSMIYLPIITK